MSVIRIVGVEPTTPPWTQRLRPGDWYHWGRLEALLRGGGGWEERQVDSVAAESLRVLRHLRDPLANPPFQCRGLVVGYVQSGKTANYTAVAARAVDAGYRIVIVLSGIHEALRSQTQNRLERELTGHQTGGLPEAENGREWIRLTRPDAEFREPDERILQAPAPFLIVAKKIVPVLERIDRWLESASRFLGDKPVLLIDDEADQASINTRSSRPPDPAVRDEEERNDEIAPSKTNALIRSILRRAPKAAYVAYTATPFANILIDPDAVDRKVGEDLFPKDFVIQLPRPDGYTGTEELFGVSAQGRNVLRIVSDDDVQVLRGRRRRRGAQVVAAPGAADLPDSLREAILSFCLAGAVRHLRGIFARKPHTMLVHVSPLTQDQERIASRVRAQLDLWREAQRQGQSLEPVFAPAWETMRAGVDVTIGDSEIMRAAAGVLQRIDVLELNSVAGENLEYDVYPDRDIIAVGGNRLSRGLTLEGLTISYFLRTASMCDTLLQMARWYGFRRGYEDLIRIWTTDGIARWFSELALVEQSLRDSIVVLARAGRRPDQMAIRLRAHSDLLLTARNKSPTAATVQDSWSGQHPQTVVLPLSHPGKISANLALTSRFLAGMSRPVRLDRGWVIRDVSADRVVVFLREYQVHDDVVAFRSDLIADWIASRTAEEELTSWTVFVPSTADGREAEIGGIAVGLTRRRRDSSDSIGILIDPEHEGVDLPDGGRDFRRRGGSWDSGSMRAARPPTQGLLIIYPLDAEYLQLAGSDPVIALALSLPETSDGTSSWVVNSRVING